MIFSPNKMHLWHKTPLLSALEWKFVLCENISFVLLQLYTNKFIFTARLIYTVSQASDHNTKFLYCRIYDYNDDENMQSHV